MIRKRVEVSGTVQGVFYRDNCRRLVNWSRRGPSQALVTMVAVHDEPAEGLSAFEIR